MSALMRYRVMAFVTGFLLLGLTLVAMPLKYFVDSGEGDIGHVLTAVIGTAHGFLFMAYLVTAVDLGIRLGWVAGLDPKRLVKLGLVCVAGTVPFMSFVAERKVTREARSQAVPA